MSAHQLIYTSCKRGINGASDGLQIFSQDAALASSGVNAGVNYQKLFCYEVPTIEGVPSFGYASIEGCGAVFNLNTKLPYDYMGEGGRKGNVLRHVIQVPVEELAFYPCELFGSSLLRDEMTYEEVNSDTSPAPLPSPLLTPSGFLSIASIAEWIEEGDRLETLESLLAAAIHEIPKRSTLVILDTPENVCRWVAALEYTLPLKLAKSINFVNYCDNPCTTIADICGSTRESFESTRQPFSQDTCVVFDMAGGVLPAYELDSSFLEFVDLAYELNYEAIRQFSLYVNDNIDTRLNADDLNASYSVYSLMRVSCLESSPEIFHAGLRFAHAQGSPDLNRELTSMILGGYEVLKSLDSETYLDVLEYLLQQWPSMCLDDQTIVERIAIGNLVNALCSQDMGEVEFQDCFNAITHTCSASGLNIFELLMQDVYRDQLFLTPGSMSGRKLYLLSEALTQFVLVNSTSLNRLEMTAPLGQLYYSLVKSALLQGANVCSGLVGRILWVCAARLEYLQTLVMVLESCLHEVFREMRASGSPQEQDLIDALWASCEDALIEAHSDKTLILVKWLTYEAYRDPSKVDRMSELFHKQVSRCSSTEDISTLYETYKSGGNRSAAQSVNATDPQIVCDYYKALKRVDDDVSLDARRRLLDEILYSRAVSHIVPSLVSDVAGAFNLKKPRREERDFVERICTYQWQTGIGALTGRAALLWATICLEDASTLNDPRQSFKDLYEMRGQLDVALLEEREAKSYFEKIAKSIFSIRIDANILRMVCDAFELRDNNLNCFLTTCFEQAVKLQRVRKLADPLAVLTMFVISLDDRLVDELYVRKLSGLKPQEQCLVKREVGLLIQENRDVPAKRASDRLFRSAETLSRGLFGRLRK